MNRLISLPVVPLPGQRLPSDLEFSYDGGQNWVRYDPRAYQYLLGYPDLLWQTTAVITVTKPGPWYCCDCTCGPYPTYCRRCGCTMQINR